MWVIRGVLDKVEVGIRLDWQGDEFEDGVFLVSLFALVALPVCVASVFEAWVRLRVKVWDAELLESGVRVVHERRGNSGGVLRIFNQGVLVPNHLLLRQHSPRKLDVLLLKSANDLVEVHLIADLHLCAQFSAPLGEPKS